MTDTTVFGQSVEVSTTRVTLRTVPGRYDVPAGLVVGTVGDPGTYSEITVEWDNDTISKVLPEDLLPDLSLPTEMLPGLPGDGFDWVEALPITGWRAVTSWGERGWQLGAPPYGLAAHYDLDFGDGLPGVFGLAVYTEGDVRVAAYSARAARDAATGREAVWWWRHTASTGPTDLAPHGLPVAPEHLAPFGG